MTLHKYIDALQLHQTQKERWLCFIGLGNVWNCSFTVHDHNMTEGFGQILKWRLCTDINVTVKPGTGAINNYKNIQTVYVQAVSTYSFHKTELPKMAGKVLVQYSRVVILGRTCQSCLHSYHIFHLTFYEKRYKSAYRNQGEVTRSCILAHAPV